MIRFNEYPPVNPGDIELTPAAQIEIDEQISNRKIEKLRDYGSTMLHAYGQSIMHAVMGVKGMERDRALEIIRPIYSQVVDTEFRAGIWYAADRAQQIGAEA